MGEMGWQMADGRWQMADEKLMNGGINCWSRGSECALTDGLH